jgi:RimJ/RimL family protein N-acetyltransferase
MIKGKQITLRPAMLDDRRTVYDWSHDSDIAPLIHLSDDSDETFQEFCDEWKEHFFTDASPELGRMFIITHEDTPVGAIAYNDIDSKNRVELDIWLSSEANCGKGFGPDAIETLCAYLMASFGVHTFMMQPSARNPRAIRAYEKVGFVATPATPDEIEAEWGGVDHHDSVLMIRERHHTTTASSRRGDPRG